MRFAYADPPYPGTARRYYQDHPDYGGEVDHRALVSDLQGRRLDGWALSTSSRSLSDVLAICRELGAPVRIGAWFRGARRARSASPVQAWEPVVYAGGRHLTREPADVAPDALIHVARPRTTDPARVIGAKPAAFCYWLFDLLGARPGDSFIDLFPGSGGVARAWKRYESVATRAETGRVAPARRDA